jgi:hypothetical protein
MGQRKATPKEGVMGWDKKKFKPKAKEEIPSEGDTQSYKVKTLKCPSGAVTDGRVKAFLGSSKVRVWIPVTNKTKLVVIVKF